MARMYITPSWRDAAAVKKPKPVVPLRYRINPVEKELDDLDKLEAELLHNADKMSDDDIDCLLRAIYVKRSKLAVKRQKSLGEWPSTTRPPKTPRIAPQAVVGSCKAKPCRPLSKLQKKLLVIGCIFGFLFFKKLLTG